MNVETAAAASRHLARVEEALGPGAPTQIMLAVREAMTSLGRKEKNTNCSYCHLKMDMTKASVEVTKQKKMEVVKVHCHRCKRLHSTKKEIDKKVFDQVQSDAKQTIEQRQKKKRKSKEANAGLIIPLKKKPSSISSTPYPVLKIVKPSKLDNSKKLKLLMSQQQQTPKRGGLQDFLSKL